MVEVKLPDMSVSVTFVNILFKGINELEIKESINLFV